MQTFEYAAGARPLDGYTIRYAIGRGGFGDVYFAVSDGGREVALKVIRHHESTEHRGLSECMNLKSPHLVTVFDVRRGEDGSLWAIMEPIAGPNLRDLIDDALRTAADGECLGKQKSAFLVREIARGLTDLHDAGVVHRDLKPENIFVERGVVKIGDYSLSKSLTVSQRSGHTATVGSVHYMAPEISEGRYDASVDIYALGAILHEMMTGRPPHTGGSVGEVLMKHLRGELAIDGVDPTVARVITRAMDRDPAMRYPTATAMADDLLSDDTLAGLAHSFRPMSLSMVDSMALRRPAAMSETAAVSVADVDTDRAPRRPPLLSPADRRLSTDPVRRTSWSMPRGLDWRKHGGEWLRFAIAVAVSSSLLMFALAMSPTRKHFLELPFFIVVVCCLATAWGTAWSYRQLMRTSAHDWFESPWLGSLLRRGVTLAVIGLVGLVYIEWVDRHSDQQFAGLLWSGGLIDWLAATHPRRKRVIQLPVVVATGVVAAVVSFWWVGDGDWAAADATLAMLVAMSLQWFSPPVRSVPSP